MKNFRVIAALIVPLIATAAFAADKEKLAQELMHASGLKHQIAQLPTGISLGLDQHRDELPPEVFDALRGAMGKAYSAEAIESKVSATIVEQLDEKVMTDTLTWLKTDLGKKITKLEEAASTPQGYQAIQDYGQQIQRQPPAANRLKLAQALDEATRATEIAVNVIEAGELGVALGLDSLRPDDEQLGLEGLMQEIAQDRPNLEAGLRELNIVGFLYTYQPLSDKELERYLEFLKSDTGVKYQEAVTAGLKQALFDAAAETARTLPETLEGEQNKQRV